MPRKYIKKTNRGVGGNYSADDLEKAIEGVRSGQFSLKAAAKEFGIPKSTLGLKVHGWRGRPAEGNLRGVPGGGRRALSVEDEESLASRIKTMSKWGFGLSRKEVIEVVGRFVNKEKLITPFKDGVPGSDWFRNFIKRHRLSIKKPELIEAARVRQQTDPFIIYDFYEKLQNVLEELGLHNCPNQIWNADETSFNYDPKNTKVVAGVGELAQRQTGGSGRKTTTVLACVNASGSKMPPMILHKGKRLWDNMFGDEEYPETSYYVSDNGWMTEEVFVLWFKNVFLQKCGERPALLIYDGHLSHISVELVTLAMEESVCILKLPPHTSAVLQPLDVAVFKALKSTWDCLLTEWQRKNLGKQLSKCDFSNLLGKAWHTMKEPIILSGFRKTGIYPINKEAISKDKFLPDKLKRYLVLQSGSINNNCNPEQNPNNDSEEHEKLSNSIDNDNSINAIGTSNAFSNNMPLEDRSVVNTPTTASTSWDEILLATVQPMQVQITKKRKRIDTAEIITTEKYLANLKDVKMNKKVTKKKIKKKISKKLKRQSSDEEESEDSGLLQFAESDDSYVPEDYENYEDVPHTKPPVQKPNSINLQLGKYIIVKTKKRAISHTIGIVMEKHENFILIRSLKRCIGYVFCFDSDAGTFPCSYDSIVGLLDFPNISKDNKLIFKEDLTSYKNIS